ncbi:MAG: hypothetical protein ACRD94_03060 [Nitrosopumilaceae archaeon]
MAQESKMEIAIKKTPVEQAGIKLDLGQNKIENLIKMASKHLENKTPKIEQCHFTIDLSMK